jgi:hypothetical protein
MYSLSAGGLLCSGGRGMGVLLKGLQGLCVYVSRVCMGAYIGVKSVVVCACVLSDNQPVSVRIIQERPTTVMKALQQVVRIRGYVLETVSSSIERTYVEIHLRQKVSRTKTRRCSPVQAIVTCQDLSALGSTKYRSSW